LAYGGVDGQYNDLNNEFGPWRIVWIGEQEFELLIKYRINKAALGFSGAAFCGARSKKKPRTIHRIEIIRIFAMHKELKVVNTPQSVKRESSENLEQYQLL
jgi:hypothetical protein